MVVKWINIVNFLKGKPRKETPKTKEIIDNFDHREEKLRRDYEEDLIAEELREREDEERYLNKLWEE